MTYLSPQQLVGLTLSVPVGTYSTGESPLSPSWPSSVKLLAPAPAPGRVRLSPLLLTHSLNLAASLPAGSQQESRSPACSSAWRGETVSTSSRVQGSQTYPAPGTPL